MGNSRLLKSGLKRADDRSALDGPSPADLFQSASSRWQVSRCKVGQTCFPQIIRNPDLQVSPPLLKNTAINSSFGRWGSVSSTHVHHRVVLFSLTKSHTFKSVVCHSWKWRECYSLGSVLVGPPLAESGSIFLFQEPADGGKLNFWWCRNHILRLQSTGTSAPVSYRVL